MTVVQSVCSHGHKLQFGDAQQAFNTGDPIKRKEPLFVRMPPGGVPGEPRGVWVQLLKMSMDWLMARERGGTVSLLQPSPTMASLGWPSTILQVEDMKSGSKQSPS